MAGRGSSKFVEKPGERAAALGVTQEQKQTSSVVSSQSISPGSYEIIQCDLFCPREGGGWASFPLKDMFVELSIFEDLYSNVLKGTITLRDTGGNMESWPIIGEERLMIIAKTSGADLIPGSASGKANYISNEFLVTSMTDIVEEKDGVKRYDLNFISPEYISNLSKKVQRSFPNSGSQGMPISTMISIIYRDYLQKDNIDRVFKIEPTKGLQKISVSNMTPFGAINFLASRAISETNPNGSLFFFYETFKDGFRFESAETLMFDGLPRATYVYRPMNVGEDVGVGLYSTENPQQVSVFDVLSNMTSGMYNSRLIAHDIVRMKYSILDYHYVPMTQTVTTRTPDPNGPPGGTPTTSANPDAGSDKNYPKHQTRSIINDTFGHLETGTGLNLLEGNRLTIDNSTPSSIPKRKYNPSVVKLFPTNIQHDILFSRVADNTSNTTGDSETKPISTKGEFGEPFIMPNQVEKWMLQRSAQLQMLNNIRIRFTVQGDTTRHVGDVVNFDMPSSLTDQGHQFYKGKYLVTHIRHRFGPFGFKTEMELAKDTFHTRMNQQKRKPPRTTEFVAEEVYISPDAPAGIS